MKTLNLSAKFYYFFFFKGYWFSAYDLGYKKIGVCG
jgi:hypothetical protein